MAGPGSWGPPPRGRGSYSDPWRPGDRGPGHEPGGQAPGGYGHGGQAPGGYGHGAQAPGGYGPGGYGPGGDGPGGHRPPQRHGPPPGPSRRPYGPGHGRPGGGYGYVPPRRRRSGGGVPAVLLLGFGALIGVCGAVYHRAVSGSGTAPIAAPAAPGKARPAAASRLYAVGRLPSAGCRGEPIVQGDPRSFRRFLNGTSDCLDREWGQGLARAGVPFRAPQRVFWSTPGRSPCGDYPSPGVAAFYCPADASIYIGVTDAQRAAGGLPVGYNVAYAREIAHEYGHAIQDMSGILAYVQQKRSAAVTVTGRNAVTKRSELQAQCLSGVFMNSVRGSYPVTSEQWSVALHDSYGRGDDGRPPGEQDHGTDAHYRGWLESGYVRGTTAACNTWAAPAHDVD